MHASFEDRDKILRGCGYHHIVSFDEKFHCTLAAEDPFNHPIRGCVYLCNEVAQLCPLDWVGRVKAEISRMFANFAAQLSLRNFCVPPWLAMYHARLHNHCRECLPSR